MHTVSEIVAHASAVGLVTQREVQSGMVSVRSAPGLGDVQAVLVSDRPVGYVKAAQSWPTDPTPPELRTSPELVEGRGLSEAQRRERDALLSLGDADLGPRLLAETEDCLWVGVVQGQRLSQVSASLPELAEILQTWGSALATLHRLPVDERSVPAAPRPWLLDADRRARAARRLERARGRVAVVRALEDEPCLRLAARQLDRRWTDRHLMHGGLTADNVVVQATQPVRVRFFSFADAGLGDPAWDLATALDTITWLARRRRTPAEPLAEYFLQGYRRSGGPAALFPAVQAVRALATAWLLDGTSSTGGAPLTGDELRFWLNRARAFAERSGRLHHQAA
jgi:hypothetical protein